MGMHTIDPSRRIVCTLDDGIQMVVGEVSNCSISIGGPFEVTEYEISMFPLRYSSAGFEVDRTCNSGNKSLNAKKVIFNPPATIILWEDKTKTVVKCDPDDTFDEMKGLALCYMKKALGNTSRELNKALRKGKNHASE